MVIERENRVEIAKIYGKRPNREYNNYGKPKNVIDLIISPIANIAFQVHLGTQNYSAKNFSESLQFNQ